MATSLVPPQAQDLLATVLSQWTTTPLWAKLASFLSLPIGYLLYLDYNARFHRWLELGPGGLPPTFRGYMLHTYFHYVTPTDTKSLAVYDAPEKYVRGWAEASKEDRARMTRSYLSEPVTKRRGPRAKALNFLAPQRERFAGEWKIPRVVEAYTRIWNDLCKQNSSVIELRTSQLEKHGEAMFLRPSLAAPFGSTNEREIGHVHSSDLSAHVCLSLADAKQVIQAGWGERHRLNGTGLLPWGYTLLYVPRTPDEVELMGRILQAGVGFMTSAATRR